MESVGGSTAPITIGEYAHLGRAQEHALVILAMNLSCWLVHGEDNNRVLLLAEETRAPAISAEIAAYERERVEESERSQRIELPHFRPGSWMTFLWATLLMAVFALQGNVAGLVEFGRSSSVALFSQGEWWRPITALFLHADLEHLVLNIVAGAVFISMATSALGSLLIWPLILAAGVLGNVITALMYYPESHLSIGASTAVFGALGLLAGYGFYLAFRFPASSPWKSVLVPLGGGLALLGLNGSGGANTDLLAHLFGFLSGTVLGFGAGWWRLRRRATH